MDADQLRADAIRRDIQARHFPELADKDIPLWRLRGLMAAKVQQAGMPVRGAWANPEQKAQARYDYAAQGRDADEGEVRWGRSQYLMDPITAKYHQTFGRDMDFLEGLHKANRLRESRESKAEPTFWTMYYSGQNPSGPGPEPEYLALQDALSIWDNSHGNLYRKDYLTPSTRDGSSLANTATNVMNNRDSLLSQWLHTSDQGMGLTGGNQGRLQGSGELGDKNTSWEQSRAMKLFEDRYRLTNPEQSPVLNLPSDATPEQIGGRLEFLHNLRAKAEIPGAGERWQRSVGWAPSPMFQDIGDAAWSLIDPSFVVTAGYGALANKPVAAAAGAAKKSLRAPQWLTNLSQDAAQDSAFEMGVNAVLSPDRSWGEYVLGTGKPPEMRTDEEVAASQDARNAMVKDVSWRWQNGERTSYGATEAERRKYKQLQGEGKVPTMYR